MTIAVRLQKRKGELGPTGGNNDIRHSENLDRDQLTTDSLLTNGHPRLLQFDQSHTSLGNSVIEQLLYT